MKRVSLLLIVLLTMACSKTEIEPYDQTSDLNAVKTVQQSEAAQEFIRLAGRDNLLLEFVAGDILTIESLEKIYSTEGDSTIIDLTQLDEPLNSTDIDRLFEYFNDLADATENLKADETWAQLSEEQLNLIAEDIVISWQGMYGSQAKAPTPCEQQASQDALKVLAGGFSMLGSSLAFGPLAPQAFMGMTVGTLVGATATWAIGISNC